MLIEGTGLRKLRALVRFEWDSRKAASFEEYRFDYRKARPNRFAAMLKGGTTAVVLDPDVASVFESPESVNRLLRSVIAALPANMKPHRPRG